MLSFCVFGVCVCACVCVCVLFIYTIFISIICVLQEELSLITSNQQMHDFCEWVELFIQCNTDSCCEHVTGDVNKFTWDCQSIGLCIWSVPLCVWFHVCTWYKIRVAVKKAYYVSDHSKLNTLLNKTHSKVLLVLR